MSRGASSRYSPIPATRQIHFIGKDIVYFHTLFWPAMLKFAGAPYKVPDNVYVHGFLTALGEKMSKSRGTGISPDYYLDLGLNSEWLRYYIAAKLNDKVEDIDFNPDDFVARVNSDLVGKYVNIASRAAKFITEHFDGVVALATAEIDRTARKRSSQPSARSRTLRCAAVFAGRARRDVGSGSHSTRPSTRRSRGHWRRTRRAARELQSICSRALFGFKHLTVILAPDPAGPRVAGSTPAVRARSRLRLGGCDRSRPTRIAPFTHLMTRIDPKQIDVLIEGPTASRRSTPAAASARARNSGAPHATDLDRRILQGRAAHREDRQRRACRRRGQAAEAHARRRRSAASHGVRRHQVGLQAGRPDRTPHADGRQPRATQDEVRIVRRHGARRFGRRSRHFPARARLGRGSRACASSDADVQEQDATRRSDWRQPRHPRESRDPVPCANVIPPPRDRRRRASSPRKRGSNACARHRARFRGNAAR